MPDYYIDDELPHLGGYIKGGDPWTWCPDLWAWFVDTHGVRSVIDIGCGEGHALRWFHEAQCLGIGIDGIPQKSECIVEWDYSKGPYEPTVDLWEKGSYDLCWSCEFVEHVEEQHVPNFLATFKCASMVAMTHAEPGQPGWHHVNCQPATYWKGVLAAIGYRYAYEETMEARALARGTHFERSGMIFTAR